MPSIPLHRAPQLIGCECGPLEAVDVTAVTEDSRRVVPGAVFVAAEGERVDGHAFAESAVAKGAVAVVGNRANTAELSGVPYLSVTHPRAALGVLAHALHGNPTEAMRVVGITGTNGKSSCVALAHQVLNRVGHPTAALGTLGYVLGDTVLPAPHTTPFGEDLAAMFGQARDAGQTHAVMEASSHALEQDRVAGISFSVAAFTNLTQDHLDYHETMDAYLASKLRLFESLRGDDAFAVVNDDDPHAQAFRDAASVPCFGFGVQGDCRAEAIRVQTRTSRFMAVTPWGDADVSLQLLGQHNVSNALCVIAICGGLDVPMDAIAEGIGQVPSVPGRFEHIDAGQEFQVIVDYAHTEDGLRNVLQAARAICDKRLISVFGCGGDRDTGKRPEMGAASAELADYSILTSDNPRTEDPARILLDIEVGVQRQGKRKNDDYLVIEQREEAIQQAIAMASAGDMVVIAGKGHEDYQILGTERIHFDDREVARAVLEGQ